MQGRSDQWMTLSLFIDIQRSRYCCFCRYLLTKDITFHQLLATHLLHQAKCNRNFTICRCPVPPVSVSGYTQKNHIVEIMLIKMRLEAMVGITLQMRSYYNMYDVMYIHEQTDI